MKFRTVQLLVTTLLAASVCAAVPYPIVDTAQVHCYDARSATTFPAAGAPFFGQDAQFSGNQLSYRDNGDGTISDLTTGLMWQQDPGAKRTFAQAMAGASTCRTGGHRDWRLPSIKELYSLIQLNGIDPDPNSRDASGLTPFIDHTVFKFQYGREEDGDRLIDSQFASRTKYVSTTMGGNETLFGVNFADGRIKGYPIQDRRRGEKRFYVLYVRGNSNYGKNDFGDNGDGTITDRATGLTWMKADSGHGMDWPDALAYAEALQLAGHSDWRLPNAKELQSIIDYTRSPDTTGSAAIDPIFQATAIRNEGDRKDFAHYWTSSSHLSTRGAETAIYFAFGRSLGWMKDRLLDVHGAGSQRSDPKVGDASNFPRGRGPQGDVIRIENYVRCVRGGKADPVANDPTIETNQAPRFITRLDRDGDGTVSRDEFDGPAEHFQHIDRNGDGNISAEEAPTGPPPGRRPRS